ncbi:MAG: hypothetical protein ACT4O6_23490 [Reyranella sp.]
MGIQIYPTVPVAEPAAEPWPVDEHTIRIDEMFARQLDIELSADVRGLLHDPETGVAARRGEAALEAIAGAMPALGTLKDRTLAQATGPRQRSILERQIDTRLDWAAGTLGRLAERATIEVDDASVADRLAGLRQDAATSWRDPAYLRKLGRTAAEELRYQGERRGWDPAETDARVRGGLSDFYAGAVEAAIGTAINGDDLDGASGLYEHARRGNAPRHLQRSPRSSGATGTQQSRADHTLRVWSGAGSRSDVAASAGIAGGPGKSRRRAAAVAHWSGSDFEWQWETAGWRQAGETAGHSQGLASDSVGKEWRCSLCQSQQR